MTPTKTFSDTCQHLPWQVLAPSTPPPPLKSFEKFVWGVPCTQWKVLYVGNYTNPGFGPFAEICCSITAVLKLLMHLGYDILELLSIITHFHLFVPMTEKEMPTELDNQILTCLMCGHENMAHPHHLNPKDLDWWIDRCSAKRFKEPRTVYTQHRKEINLIGVACVMAEEFYMKYGAQGLLSREDLFQYLLFLPQGPSLVQIVQMMCRCEMLHVFTHSSVQW